MKNKFIRFVSSVLIVTLLISCFSVLTFADTEGADDTVSAGSAASGVTLLTNRTFGEGWSSDNGFNLSSGGNNFSVEYEQTEDYGYNYYTRVEGTSSNEGYLEAYYGKNPAAYGHTIFEFDIKIDDDTDIGTIAYTYRKESANAECTIPLAAIQNNKLYLMNTADLTVVKGLKQGAAPDYLIGDVSKDWIRVAYSVAVTQKICPVCQTVTSLKKGDVDSSIICCEGKEGAVSIDKMADCMTITVYYGYAETFDPANAIKQEKSPKEGEELDLTKTYKYSAKITNLSAPDFFRLGLPANGANNFGSSFIIDNVKLYNGSELPVDVAELGYGANVNTAAAKTVEILGGDKTVTQFINEGLAMKLGTSFGLMKGNRTPIMMSEDKEAYGAPVKIDGRVYVSLQAVLDWVGYPMYAHEDGISLDISTATGSTYIGIGRDLATANGKLIQLNAAPGVVTDEKTGLDYIVVAIEDIEILFEGCYATYDEMGLIIISGAPDIVNRENDLALMLDVVKRFVYEDIDASKIYDAVKENTNNFQHPYIAATQNDFDRLYGSSSANVKKYIEVLKADADKIYEEFTTPVTDDFGVILPKQYAYLAADIINPNTLVENQYLNSGYDFAVGSLDAAGEYNEKILTLAFAYQVTRNEDYALLAYDMAVSMAAWEHWGPAYFVSLADATVPYVLAYDWLYNVWSENGCDLAVVENAIYDKAIRHGYNSTIGSPCEIVGSQGDLSAYTTRTDSWNVVGTSAMVIGSLALLGVKANMDADGRTSKLYDDTYISYSEHLIANNLKSLTSIGLDIYAPDGSFSESPSHWGYATNALCLMSWALNTAVGGDFGIMNAAGMDKTFYYAYQIEYNVSGEEGSGYQYWAYHDAVLGYTANEMAFYAAYALSDLDIAALRLSQLDKKPVSIWDVLAYDERYDTLDFSQVKLALDYTLENCEGIISRSSWENGAIMVGMMGGRNDVIGGQIDSGNFVYSSNNYNWICDLGGEYHGVLNYNDDSVRYNYYRMNGDGNNVVIVTSSSVTSVGQLISGNGQITEYVNNENGMYAILDNTSAYGSVVTDATRGVLFTNNRTTFIVQDEINFQKSTTCAWVVHTPLSNADVQISSDGRTAYLTKEIDGEIYCLRASIVSALENLQFTSESANKSLLSATQTTKNETNREQYSRNEYRKLYIQAKNMLSFECAVVFEMVSFSGSTEEVEYTYTKMSEWGENLLTDAYVSPVVDEYYKGAAMPEDILYSKDAAKLYNGGLAFSTKLKDFYQSLVYCAECVKLYLPTGRLDGELYAEAYEEYLVYQEMFGSFRTILNNNISKSEVIGINLSGYRASVGE